MNDALKCAIEKAGGIGKLSRALGIRRQAIYGWHYTGRIPAERVIAIERITGVSREELRPDLYPAPLDARPSDPIDVFRANKARPTGRRVFLDEDT